MRTLLLSALFGCAILASAQLAETTKFSGTVTDPSGAVVPRANVGLYWKAPAANHPDLFVKTDPAGRFLASVPPGLYDVCALAQGFVPTCETVTVGVQEAPPRTLSLKIDARPICGLSVLDIWPPSEEIQLPDSIPVPAAAAPAKPGNTGSVRNQTSSHP